MTTDQIKNVESAAGAPHGVPDPDIAADRATNEARQIIAKARYEAFRMVTEARNEADAILDHARAEAADLIGTSVTNDTVAGENADLIAVNAALREEYNELVDLIDGSQQLIERLEIRLLDLATMPDTIPSLDGSIEEVAIDVGSQVAPYVFDYSPAVAPPPKPSRTKSTERAETFYTRKSAKLPRIGTEGGKDALDCDHIAQMAIGRRAEERLGKALGATFQDRVLIPARGAQPGPDALEDVAARFAGGRGAKRFRRARVKTPYGRPISSRPSMASSSSWAAARTSASPSSMGGP